MGTTCQPVEWLDTSLDLPLAVRAYLATQLVSAGHRCGLVRHQSTHLSEAQKHGQLDEQGCPWRTTLDAEVALGFPNDAGKGIFAVPCFVGAVYIAYMRMFWATMFFASNALVLKLWYLDRMVRFYEGSGQAE